jgi:N-alpha-acetyltransferase 15/16, NatA auxiliary subunit
MADDNGNHSNNPQVGANRPLPKKEFDLFRAVVRHYEGKQYKKAIKTADSILKRYPTHGETLAMKGLALNALNYHAKREEAHELVKKALTHDMRCVHKGGTAMSGCFTA